MHLIKRTVQMLEELIYKEFTEKAIADIDTCEVGRVADILKDLTQAMHYYDECESEESAVESADEELTIEQLLSKLSILARESDMTSMEKNTLKNKMQMIIQSM